MAREVRFNFTKPTLLPGATPVPVQRRNDRNSNAAFTYSSLQNKPPGKKV